jgi:hypothetical protein
MPKLTKEAMSQYVRTECRRQLRLYLSPDNQQYQAERSAQGMPAPQPPRPGLEQIVQAGEEWEAKVLQDITEVFGTEAMVGEPYEHSSGQTRYHGVALDEVLADVTPESFIVEAQFRVGTTFESELGISDYPNQYELDYAEIRPDIIEVLPPGSFHESVAPSGDVYRLDEGDERRQLRVIDIKLTAKPTPSYFIQVAYYSMALAGWLSDNDFDQDFVVVPNAAIWPGSHQASNFMTRCRQILSQGEVPCYRELRAAMEQDLEPVPFEVFAFRVRGFLQEDIPYVLSRSWQNLEWHVDNRCSTCEYLGYPWLDSDGEPTNEPDHCIPTARRTDHLSRVAFLSRGASAALQSRHIETVDDLSQISPEDRAFDTHQILRASRTVISGRANSLQTQQPDIPPLSGTSASMPRWADLRIYLSADFDIGSAITFALGVKAFWLEPSDYGDHGGSRDLQRWPARVFIVDEKSLESERRELLAFLDHIREILTRAHSLDDSTSVQFYLWDSLQYDHLTRVFGRHLQAILADENIRNLTWLFPPEDVLPNPDTVVRRSPITIVRDVVRALLAAPIPHYYTLLETARVYHHEELPEGIAEFSIHPLFEDVLSDQIPSERAHEIWTKSTSPSRYWRDQMDRLDETVSKRLIALETVVRRLEEDLRPLLLQDAPRISIGPPDRETRLSFDSQLWYAFAKLNAALEELEVQQKRAMPPHEREARFCSARLRCRIVGSEKQDVLDELDLQDAPGRRVYEMRENSREVKFRANDFNCALAPEEQDGFLDQNAWHIIQETPLEQGLDLWWGARMEDVTAVNIKTIDRNNGWIVVDPKRRWPSSILDDLEEYGIADLSTDVILDPVHYDYFTRKLRRALRAIGNPSTARTAPLVRRATGQVTGRGANRTAHTPAADFLWNVDQMAETLVTRDLARVKPLLIRCDLGLNSSQWQAWEEALSHRLQLIWGPPGSGKSRTARAIVLGAVLEAYQQSRPVRVLICSATYRAMDNVLLGVYDYMQNLIPDDGYRVYRLHSYLQPEDSSIPSDIDVSLNRHHPSSQVVELLSRLEENIGVTIVGATPGQTHNLLRILDEDLPQEELFDLILIDEASQMDVAHAILPFCGLAEDGSVILAGDPKQLAPIHQTQGPLGLEDMVGSIYKFYRSFHGAPDYMLETNYRSNSTIVDFSLNAGYRTTLSSHSPDLCLNLVAPLPTQRPSTWPEDLYWTEEWSQLLRPEHPTACFLYPEGRSSQWNEFEADVVASIIYTLFGRLGNQLLNERDSDGHLIPSGDEVYTPEGFWKRAVGVVTPHRAQQGLVVSRLQRLFAGTEVSAALIRDAVDTVERFQGQQRDVMIASFALGDPDAIRDEDEFLMNLNRFNVMASRARAKLIVLVSQEIVDHLSADIEVLRDSRLLKIYAESFCENSRPMTLGFIEDETPRDVSGLFRYRT